MSECYKQRFETRAGAIKIMKRINKRHKGQRMKLVHECKFCKGWHLSTQKIKVKQRR